jgi:transposase
MRIIGVNATDPPADLPALPDTLHLPDDPATLKAMVLELLASLHEHRRDNEALRHRLDLLLRRLYGPRGERFDPNQPLLFADLADGPDAAAAPTEPAAQAQPKRRCRPHGRRRLPEHLRREQRHYELSAADRVCPGCGTLRIDIGVDQSEQLDYQPASLFVIEHIVHKYACPSCAAAAAGHAGPADAEAAPPPAAGQPSQQQPPAGAVVIAAAKPPMAIAKGLPGAGLLAHLIVSKYVDHLPLYRLERVYERQGLFLARSTTCDWLAACAQALRPLYDLMVAAVLASRALHTDDTPVQIHDPPPGGTDTGRLWVYLGDTAHAYNVFDFTPNRQRDGPQRFLADFRGYLHADAFSGYDGLYLPRARAGPGGILEVACNAHARRKFYEARTSDAVRAHQALAYYGQLYEIERQAKDKHFDEDQVLRLRQDLAVPILDQFQKWLEAERVAVLPKGPMGEAIGYALRQWAALARYTEAGFLAIDNNAAEREMKRIAIGRKNWLFVGSVRGGATAAVLFSFTSTCQRLGVEPWAYLQDVLSRLPGLPAERHAELLPDRWQDARQAQTTPT